MDLHLITADNASPPPAANDGPDGRFTARRRNGGRSSFDIYRSESVSLTSTLFGGGDWHWRLKDSAGAIVADCGGYRNQAECVAAVQALRAEAGSATLSRHP